MLGFNYDLSPTEVIEIIKNNELDKDIKDYIYDLIDLDELKKNRSITEYFDLTCFSEKDNEYYLCVGACVDESEYSSMTNTEKELHNKFQSKVITIYDEVMAEIKNKNII